MIIEVSEVNMADHEIQRLQRKLRAAEHRIEKLTKVHTSLQQGHPNRPPWINRNRKLRKRCEKRGRQCLFRC